jgi:Protein of unknown function (DUF2845)
MRSLSLALVVAALIQSSIATADSMRCGQWIVDESVSTVELRHKCGEPTSKEVKTEEARGRTVSGSSVSRGTVTTEKWTYQRSGSFVMVVTIVDGKIKSIQRAE